METSLGWSLHAPSPSEVTAWRAYHILDARRVKAEHECAPDKAGSAFLLKKKNLKIYFL